MSKKSIERLFAMSWVVLMLSATGCGGSVVGAPCEEGKKACPNGCFDLEVTHDHCGSCGKSCGSDEVCLDGGCVRACEATETRCGLECVDLSQSVSHCGECQAACRENEVCINGTCQIDCQEPRKVCDDQCVDPLSDSSHCGQCGNTCPEEKPVCVYGVCDDNCPEWMSLCDGACIDTAYDPLNCGGCEVLCPGRNPFCLAGKCVEECPGEFMICERQCIDTQTNTRHCGTCGNICADGDVCLDGTCQKDCGNKTDCSGACVDLDSNESHCGACGNVCDLDEICIAGQCALDCGNNTIACGEQCVDPLTNSEHCGRCDRACSDDRLCRGGRCIPNCGTLQWCGSALMCVDLTSDRDNCGQCDKKCDDGWFCVDSKCRLDCPDTHVQCGRQCIDTATDPRHCGNCDKKCVSGICDQGECRDQSVGHLVAIGHDFMSSHNILRSLLGNAVFIPTSPSVRVLGYVEHADQGENGQVARVNRAIDQDAEAKGRGWERTIATTAEQVVEELYQHDVLLVYRQSSATDEQLQQIGESWAGVLSNFLHVGGSVIFTDAVGGNTGTWQIFSSAGLFECSGVTSATNHTALVLQPGDAVASGVTINYLASANSAFFSTSEKTVVVQDEATQAPLVIHKTFTP